MVDILICVYILFSLSMFQSSSSVREWSSQDPMRTPMSGTINTDHPGNGPCGRLHIQWRSVNTAGCVRAKELALPLLGIVRSRSIYDNMALLQYIDS